MSTPDAFGRLRLLLMETHRDGREDHSAARLQRIDGASALNIPDYTRPFIMRPSDDGVVGEVFLVAPAHRRAYWLRTAAELRGRYVRVEATVRRYCFGQSGGLTTEDLYGAGEENITRRGFSLDIFSIELVTESQTFE